MFYKENEPRMSDGDLYYTAGFWAVYQRKVDGLLISIATGIAKLSYWGLSFCAKQLANASIYGCRKLIEAGSYAIEHARQKQLETGMDDTTPAMNDSDSDSSPDFVPEEGSDDDIDFIDGNSLMISQHTVESLKALSRNVGFDVDTMTARTLRNRKGY